MTANRAEVAEKIGAYGPNDYASAFAVAVVDAEIRSPVEWAKATYEDAPVLVRWFVVFGWRYILGFRLGPRRRPGYVLAWKVVDTTADAVTLTWQSSRLVAHKVVQVEDSQVAITTFVRYERPSARVFWLIATPVHHRTEPYLLSRAASRSC